MDFFIWHRGYSSSMLSNFLFEDMDESEAILKAQESISSKAQKIADKEKRDVLFGLFNEDVHLVRAWTVTKSGEVRCEPVENIHYRFNVTRIKRDYKSIKWFVSGRKPRQAVVVQAEKMPADNAES